MSELRDYSLCTSHHPASNYHQQLHLGTSRLLTVDSIVSCAMQMRSRESEVATTMATQLGQTPAIEAAPVAGQNRGSSILYNILNSVNPSSSSSTPRSVPGKVEKMEDEQMEMVEDEKLAGNGSETASYLSAFPFVDPNAYRTRSDSFNSVGHGPSAATLSRTPSGGSLASSVGLVDSEGGCRRAEALMEATVKRLLGLSTGEAALAAEYEAQNRSRSHPGTPPTPMSYPEPRRKFSMGSRLSQMQPTITESAPVDLSCKRTRYAVDQEPSDAIPRIFTVRRSSILESLLSKSTIRERSHTLAVCGARGLPRAAAVAGAAAVAAHRHRVTLAKKTLFPVTARVAEQLRRAIEFARSLPEFCALPLDDQVALLNGALPRLLLLYLAEVNMQFAVTSSTAEEDHHSGTMCSDAAAASTGLSGQPNGVDRPTMQFVDSIQNFIRKCQSLQISPNEYFYMRMIVLFHTGSATGTLNRSDVVDRVGAEARQDLQDFARHNRPAERLRYSSLLLTLHTVFGVNCGQLATLFCRQVQGFGVASSDFGEFVRRELCGGSRVDVAH